MTVTRSGVVVDSAKDVTLFGRDALVIRGAAARETYAVVALGLRLAKQNGAAPSPRMLAVAAGLKVVADAAIIASEHPCSPEEYGNVPSSPLRGSLLAGDHIGAAEAAGMLGYTIQHTRRLGPALGGYKPPTGPWVFSKASVEAFIIERAQQESA